MHDSAVEKELPMDTIYEIRFRPLFRGNGLCFPCDAQGHVELDALSDRARENYLYARAVVGAEFAHPTVCRAPGPNAH